MPLVAKRDAIIPLKLVLKSLLGLESVGSLFFFIELDNTGPLYKYRKCLSYDHEQLLKQDNNYLSLKAPASLHD